jgi:preprotein translocase subunit SecB
MSDASAPTNGAPAGTAEQPQQAAAPSLQVATQYVKDLSFENPNAPRSLAQQGQPQVTVNVDVKTNVLAETTYEVVLNIKAEAKAGDATSFLCELSYAGVIVLKNVSKEQTAPLLLIEAPRLLFPFARAVIAEATRNGGFPPLLVQPIDFTDLFRRQLAALRAKQTGEAAAPSPTVN